MKSKLSRFMIFTFILKIIPLSAEANEAPKAGNYLMSKLKIAPKFLQSYDFKIDPKSEEIIDMVLLSERQLSQSEMRLPFSEENIKTGDYVLIKGHYDKTLGIETRRGRAAWEQNDRAEILVGGMKVKSLEQMDKNGLRAARLRKVPWSSDYWPTYAGGAARRYADKAYETTHDWKENVENIRKTIPTSAQKLSEAEIDLMSPAQKYDLLVGDKNFTLTKMELLSVENASSRSGKVELWEGKCHGWSPAAFSESRPHHATYLRAYDPDKSDHKGPLIRFYPDDIKALATTYWANTPSTSHTVGSRCNNKNPKTDENGRILDLECFDTNPGTWHLLVVNQIGVKKKSFVLDATYDYQVWNQPAFSYEYTYFNPKDSVKNWDADANVKYSPVKKLKDARVMLDSFPEDKYKTYRGKGAVSVVGVDMKFTYVAEVAPSHIDQDSSKDSRLVSVHYYYDIELDADGKILGGEWYELAHPDFMWTPTDIPQSIGDQELLRNRSARDWMMREINPVFTDWRNAALSSSEKGQPLRHIIKELINKSRKTLVSEQIDDSLSKYFNGVFNSK